MCVQDVSAGADMSSASPLKSQQLASLPCSALPLAVRIQSRRMSLPLITVIRETKRDTAPGSQDSSFLLPSCFHMLGHFSFFRECLKKREVVDKTFGASTLPQEKCCPVAGRTADCSPLKSLLRMATLQGLPSHNVQLELPWRL